jgi:hypothetical protein
MSYLGLNSSPILINNVEYGWSSITLSIGGLVIKGITNISYSENQQAENIYGAGGRPVSRGVGNREATASITIHKSEYFALQKAAKAKGYESILDLPFFDVTVIYQPVVGSVSFTKDVIKNSQFITANAEASQGDLAIEVTLDIVCSHILLGA